MLSLVPTSVLVSTVPGSVLHASASRSPSIRPDNELDELQSQSDFPSPARSLRSRQSILPFPAGEPVPDTAKSVLAALKSAVKSDFASKTSSVTKSVISCFL